MELKGICNYLGLKKIESKKNAGQVYYYASVTNEQADKFEMQVNDVSILNTISQFEKVEVVVDVFQGQYPKYKLIRIKKVV